LKTGIITFHFVNNYGGALQAYALRRYMSENFCKDTELIDYRHWFIRLTDAVRMAPLTLNFRYYGPWLRSFGKMRSRRRKFADFMRRRGNLSPRVDLAGQFRRLNGRYRLMICGSDQIWNPMLTCGLARPYFLAFPMDHCKRISYAASVGGTMYKRDKMLEYIRKLDAVSIREKTDWLESDPELSPVDHHIDPTLLLTRREWQAIAVPPKQGERYILTYFMQKNEGAYAIVEQIKRETGCKVYDISRYGYQPNCVDECLVDVGPEEFVGLFASAQHVCTNSFHGLVFSLIFDKTVDYIPIQRFGGRIEYLCALLHIEKTPVQNGAYYHMAYDPAQKDAILEVERQKARAYLEKGTELAHDNDH